MQNKIVFRLLLCGFVAGGILIFSSPAAAVSTKSQNTITVKGLVTNDALAPIPGTQIHLLVFNDKDQPLYTDELIAISSTGAYEISFPAVNGQVEIHCYLPYEKTAAYMSIPREYRIIKISADQTKTLQEDYVLYRIDPSTIVTGVVDQIVSTKLYPNSYFSITFHELNKDLRQSIFTTPLTDSFSAPLIPGTYEVLVDTGASGTLRDAGRKFTIAAGQKLNLGVVQPIFWDQVVSASQQYWPQILVGQTMVQTKSGARFDIYDNFPLPIHARFAETFQTTAYADMGLTSGAAWERAGLVLHPGGTAVSLPISPATAMIQNIELLDNLPTPTDRTLLEYAVSADGIEWLKIIPGVEITAPPTWDTSRGLRWRVALPVTASSDVRINAVRIYYTASIVSLGRPIIDLVRAQRGKQTIQLMIYGHNFRNSSVVYIDGRRVRNPVVINSSLIRGTIKRKTFVKNENINVLVVTPWLQGFEIGWNPITLRTYRPTY